MYHGDITTKNLFIFKPNAIEFYEESLTDCDTLLLMDYPNDTDDVYVLNSGTINYTSPKAMTILVEKTKTNKRFLLDEDTHQFK